MLRALADFLRAFVPANSICARANALSPNQPQTFVRWKIPSRDSLISADCWREPSESGSQASFNFLGFAIQMSRGASTGKLYPNVRPAAKSLKKIKAKLTALTGRNLTALDLGDIVGNVNRSL